MEWAGDQHAGISRAAVFSTGTTGSRIKAAYPDLNVTWLKSGPLGGNQQIGAMICGDKLDAFIFVVDPLSPMPHDVEVKALTRSATVYDLPMACSRSTADPIVKGLLGDPAG